MFYCCICGNEGAESAGDLWVKVKSMPICEECAKDLDDLESEEDRKAAIEKLNRKMRASNCSYSIIEAVREIIE